MNLTRAPTCPLRGTPLAASAGACFNSLYVLDRRSQAKRSVDCSFSTLFFLNWHKIRMIGAFGAAGKVDFRGRPIIFYVT